MFRSLPCLLCAVLASDPARAAFQIDSSVDILRPTPTVPSDPAGSAATPVDCDLSMVVAPGDTLISIARQKLGNAGRLGELLEINRDRVRNPDVLRSGMTLRLPCDAKEEDERQMPDAVAADSEATAGEPAAVEAPEITAEALPAAEEQTVASGSDAPACERETVVRPGDTLGAIARRQLGNAGRLGELLEINRDRVRNPDVLRSGMTLRLPCDPTAATETGTTTATTTETNPVTEVVTTDAPPAIDSAKAERQGPGTVAADSEETVRETATVGTAAGEDETPSTAGADDAVTPSPVTAIDEGEPITAEIRQEQAGDVEADETDTTDTTVRNLGGQPYATLSWGHDALWEANRGERLDNVLARWGQRAGYTVIIRDRYPWIMGLSYEHRGNFLDAVEDLLKGFATAGRSPGVTIYANDVMMLETR